MRNLSTILLLVLALLLSTFVASAGGPPTSSYLVSKGWECRLPDAIGRPQGAEVWKIEFSDMGANVLKATCAGALPSGSVLPAIPLKLTFNETKVYCATFYGLDVLLSDAYGAVVYPDGTSTISCLFAIPQ